jgi:hypothetical protein
MYQGEYDHELFSTYVSPEGQQRRDAELAKTREINEEAQRLHKIVNSVPWRLFRIVVRLGRILIGGIMLVVVYSLFMGSSPLAGLVRLPFAAMSVGSLFALFFWFGIFAAFIVLGWNIAFGEPPGDEALWSDARRNVLDRHQRNADEQIKKARIAAYSKSKVLGLLTDPDMGLAGDPGIKALILISGCVLFYLVLMFVAAIR